MALDIKIINQLKLNSILKLNDIRSYRDGDSLFLNFEVIDKNRVPIFSFAYSCNRFDSNEFINVRRNILNSKKGRNFNTRECACKIGLWSMEVMLYPGYDEGKPNTKLGKPEVFNDFMSYIFDEMCLQVSNIINHLDFFSLQTKEDYMEEEMLVNEYLACFKESVLDENEDNEEYWDNRLDNEFNHLDDEKYEFWIKERSREILMDISFKQTPDALDVNLS